MNDSDQTAVLLIAHGSRRPEANEDLVRLSQMVRETNRYPIVEIAYLELAEPTIPQGATKCVERGAKRVLMLPYFLSAGVHVRSDLKEFQSQFRDQFEAVSFEVCEPLGLHPGIVEVVFERLKEVE